jgi:hypothetical protein
MFLEVHIDNQSKIVIVYYDEKGSKVKNSIAYCVLDEKQSLIKMTTGRGKSIIKSRQCNWMAMVQQSQGT